MQHVWGPLLDQFPYILNSTFLGQISGAILCMCLNSFSQNLLIWKFSSVAFCVDVMTQTPVCFMYHVTRGWPLDSYKLIFSTEWYLSVSLSIATDKDGHIYYPVGLWFTRNRQRENAFLSELTESTHIPNDSLTFTLMSNNSVAEERAKKFHPGELCILSPREEKVLWKLDRRSLKQSKALSGPCKCFPVYSRIKAVFKK